MAAALKRFVSTQNLGVVMAGEVGCLHRPEPRIPCGRQDVLSVPRTGCARSRPQGFLDVAPELIVEILSPTDRSDPVQRKLREYFAAGVRLVWVIDPAARTVQVHRDRLSPCRWLR